MKTQRSRGQKSSLPDPEDLRRRLMESVRGFPLKLPRKYQDQAVKHLAKQGYTMEAIAELTGLSAARIRTALRK